jgi:hypothetical protein
VVSGGLEAHRDQAPDFIVEGISVFLSLFDDNPKVKRVFCPEARVLRPGTQRQRPVRKAVAFILLALGARLPLFSEFPVGMNAGLAKAIGVMMNSISNAPC